MIGRRLNGHVMEIQIMREMGGGLEEVVFWCHTCDERGEYVRVYDLRETSLKAALKDAQQYGDDHAQDRPCEDGWENEGGR